MSGGIVYASKPNKRVFSYDPPDTSWHQVTLPTYDTVPRFGGSVAMKSVAAGGVSDGSLFLVNFGQDVDPTTAAEGFPISGSGQCLVVDPPDKIWIMASVATDFVQMLFEF